MTTVWLLLLLVLCSQSVDSHDVDEKPTSAMQQLLKEVKLLREQLSKDMYKLRKSVFPTTFATT